MLYIFGIKKSNTWDKIIKSFSKYDVYYLSGYLKAFQLNGDGEPLLLFYEDENLKAANVVFKRDISNFKPFENLLKTNRYYDVSTPYGYGGWLIESKDSEHINLNTLKEEYYSWCSKNSIISEFTRFHPINKNYLYQDCLYDSLIHCGDTVCLDTTSEDVIWANIISKNRNMIRKAQKSGVEIKITREPFIIKHFMAIYNETMKGDNAEEYYYFKEPFYESIREDLKDNALWFYAVLNNEIIASSIFLFSNGNMHYHLSGSRREYRSFAATNLILFEAAKWASQNACQKFHLGGGLGSKSDNLYKFKKSFMRGPDTEFWVGKTVFDNDVYRQLVELRRKNDPDYDVETNFFPKYRG